MISESLCIHSLHCLSWRESLQPVFWFTGVLGMEETPLLTAHQPVSWSSPGLTSGRTLHRMSLMWMVQFMGFYWLATSW